MFLVALHVGCSDPVPSSAEIQAARSAPTFATKWDGAWTIRAWAADPGAPGPRAMGAALGVPVNAWDGVRPTPTPGTAEVVWIPTGTAFDRFPPPLQRPQGQVVAVLAPGDPTWAERAEEALPWAGFSIVDPTRSARPWLDTPTDELAGYVAAWVVAEHYQKCVRPCFVPVQATLPAGLDVLLGPWDPALLAAPDVRTRAEAVRHGGDLSAFLQDSVAVRLGVASATKDPTLLGRLAADPEPLVRARAADSLTDVAILTTLSTDPSSVVRVVATDRLGRLETPDAAPALRAAARSPDAYQRWKAAWGLGKLPGNTDALLPLLADPDIDVRREAARSLGRQHDPAAVEPLISALKDPNSFVRRWAAVGLGEERDPRALDALLAAARDPTALVAQSAAHALANLGRSVPAPPFNPPGKPRNDAEIDSLVGSPDATIRKDVCKFLAGRADAGQWLQRLEADPDSEVRKSAVEAMGWHADTVAGAVPLLQDIDPDVVVTALDALRRATAGDVETVSPLLAHSDGEVRLRAAEVLAALGPNDPLRALLSDPDERIRAAVVGVYPDVLDPAEPSVLVRRAARRSDADPLADPVNTAWAEGILLREDDLLHQRFSWNEEEDRPSAHSALRPPVPRAYGHPNRG